MSWHGAEHPPCHQPVKVSNFLSAPDFTQKIMPARGLDSSEQQARRLHFSSLVVSDRHEHVSG